MTLHAYLYCLDDPTNKTDPTGRYWGVLERAKRVVGAINTYNIALGAALRATPDPADMLDWLPEINAYREYLFSPENLNRKSMWQTTIGGSLNNLREICNWPGVVICLKERYDQVKLTIPLFAFYCVACWETGLPAPCFACGSMALIYGGLTVDCFVQNCGENK